MQAVTWVLTAIRLTVRQIVTLDVSCDGCGLGHLASRARGLGEQRQLGARVGLLQVT